MEPWETRPVRRSRGSALLLEHCASLERLVAGERRRRAHGRLEATLGPELACVLVRALATDYRPRSSLGVFL
jgi:hypothetical protein